VDEYFCGKAQVMKTITTPVEKCNQLATAALDEIYSMSPDDRPMESVNGLENAQAFLTKWLCRAYIEGQHYVAG